MIKILLNKYDKNDVVNMYLDIIKKSVDLSGNTCEVINDKSKVKRNDIVVTTNIDDAFKIFYSKKCRMINWYQGIRPEESYIRNKSLIKKNILEYVEKKILKKSLLNIFVSEGMKLHYERKYNLKISNYFIMPCFNAKLNGESFNVSNKYKNLNFTYVGGLSKWQCIEETLRLYKSIEVKYNNASLKFLTNETERANQLIKKYKIENVEIKYVKNDELFNELKDVKYGFILREDNPINFVATPTKISTYLSNGIIPITTTKIHDTNIIFKDTDYKVFININDNLEKNLQEIMKKNSILTDNEKILTDYTKIFDVYYNEKKYIEKLVEIFNGIL